MDRLSRRGAGWFLVFLLGLFAAVLPAAAEDGVFEPLSITVTGGKRHDFQVEVMRTSEEHQRGMMYRRSLDPDKGMLFEFAAPQVTSFWMQNTYVSLDMIFIRPDGIIHRIHRSAEPLSTVTISSGAPVKGVLEVVAGTSERLGIRPGDRVGHVMFEAP